MKAHFRFLCLSLAMLCIGAVSRAQVTGAVSVPNATYPDLASVITALNTLGVGSGGATITVTTGNAQYAPAGGYRLGSTVLNASLTAANPLVINGSGNTVTGAGGVGSNDGIFWLLGTDYVTVNNLNILDTSSTTATTSVTGNEYGYVLGKLNTTAPYDGCQFVTISNCSISLNKYQSASTGIYGAHINATSTSISTASYAVGDANSDDKITGNTITNVSRGIYFLGSSAALATYDKRNIIGGTTTTQGNTITLGGTANTNTLYGLYCGYDSVFTVQYNKFSVAAAQTANATVYFFYPAGAGKGTLNFLNNYMNVTVPNTSASVYCYYQSSTSYFSDAGAIRNVNNNEITGSCPTATSASLYCIYDYTPLAQTLNINNNYIHDIYWATGSTTSTSSSTLYCIGNGNNVSSSTAVLNVLGNTVYNINRYGPGSTYLDYNYQYISNIGKEMNIKNNTFRKIKNYQTTGTGSNYVYAVYNYAYPNSTAGTDLRINYQNNIIDSLDMSDVTSTYGYVYSYINYYGGDSTQITDNQFINWTGTTASSTYYTYWYTYGYSYYGPNGTRISRNTWNNFKSNLAYFYNYSGYYCQYYDSNTISNINMAYNGGSIAYFYNYLGYYGGYYSTLYPFGFARGNSIYNINFNGATSVASYIYLGSYGRNVDVSGNKIRKITMAATNSLTPYNYMGAYAYGLKCHDNWVDSIQNGTGTMYPFYVYTNGNTDSVYNNRVSNLSTLGTTSAIYGYYLGINGASDGYRFYNNAMSNIEVPTTYNGSNLYGVYTTGTGNYSIYNNTIRINPSATVTGSNYGATGIYYATSGTYDFRNNIINVNVTPGATATTIALRRASGATGTVPVNFLGTSNSNIFWVPTNANAYYYGEGTSTTIANGYNQINDVNFNTPCGLFKSFMGHDYGSFYENLLTPSAITGAYVPFGTSYAEKGATPTTLPAVTTDLAGSTRGTPADIGDLEFSGSVIDNAPPQISYALVPSPVYCITTPTIVATITDQTGVANTLGVGSAPGTAPKLYYKKSTDANAFGGGNTSATNGWKWVEPSSISGSQYTFNMDYSLINGGASTVGAGTTIQYFIIAQDITLSTNTAANVAGFASCPTSVNLVAANGPTNASPALNTYSILNPSAFVAKAALNKICVSGATTISLTPDPLGTALQWESATLTGAFTPITGATGKTYTTPVLTSTTRYRATLYCGTTALVSTTPDTVTVSNPVITSTTSAVTCGFGPATLSAATNAGTSVNWYTSATGTSPVATGNTFTTPNLSSSTTYYASAVVPKGSTESIKITPTGYYSYWSNPAGYGMAFNFGDTVDYYSTTVYPLNNGNLYVDLVEDASGNTIRTAGPFALVGTANNYTNPTTLNLGWKSIPPGDYHIVVNSTTPSTLQLLYHYYASGVPSFSFPVYSNVTGRSKATGGYYPSTSPPVYPYYWFFFYNNIISGPCENPTRYPVTATVTPSTPITASSPNLPGICVGGSASLTVSSTSGTYLYSWYANALPAPITSTTPAPLATGTPASVTPTANTKYYVIGNDVITGCRAIDSVTLFVNPQQAAPSITPINPTICQNSAVQLTATPVPFGGTGTVGSGTIQNGVYGYPSPGGNEWTADHEQYLLTPAELNAAGITAGQFNSVAFDLATSYTGYALQSYTIKMAQTTLTSVNYTSFLCTGFTTVYGPTTYTPPTTTGYATIPFTNSFTWNGTSNVLIDITFTNGGTGCATSYAQCMNVNQSTTSYVSSAYAAADGNCTITSCTPSGPSVYGNVSQRPNMRFNWGRPYTLNWVNVNGLYKNYPPLSGALTTTDTNKSVWASPVTTQVYRAVTNAQGCISSPSNPDTVFVNPAPPTTVTPAGAQTICSGNSVTLCAPSGATMTYQWLLNNAVIAGATANCYTASSAGNYRVRVVNLATGCFDTSVISVVNVNALPTASIPVPATATTFCNGGSVVLGPVTTNASPAGYQWYNGGTAISGATSPSYTATTSGTYTVTVINSNQCTQTSNSIVVTVNTVPNTVTPTGSTTFCTGGSVTLNAPTTGTGAPFTYQWYNGTSAIAGATSSTYTATTSGNYSVVISSTTLTPACTSTSSQTAVVVGSAPSSAITPSGAQNLCSGDSVLLTTNTSSGITIDWKLNGTSTGVTTSTYWAKLAGSYTATVSITGTPTCNSTTATPTVITVNPKPTVTASAGGAATTFCNGGSVTLTGSTGTTAPATSWQWKLNGAAIAGATSSTYIATQSGSYTVTGSNSFGCGTTSAPIVITVNPLPAVTITQSGPANICQGGTLTLTSSPATFVSYQWKVGGVNAAAPSTSSSYSVNTTGNYTVTVTDGNGCSNTSTPVGVLVNPLPLATTSPSGSVNICSGSTVTLTTPTISNTTVQWINPAVIGGATQRSYTTGTAGSYSVVVTNTVTGCQNTSPAVVVTVSAPPTVTATRVGLPTICAGDSSRINATAAAGVTYQWNYNGAPVAGATSSSYYAKNQGTYTVTVANGSCSSTSTGIAITVNPAPPAYITYNTPVTFCAGSAVALTANTGAGLTYLWIINGTPTTNTSGSYIANTSGVYALKTTNGFGCAGYSDTLRITVNPVPTPTIVRTNSSLSTTQAYASYQWFLNNSGIGGATNATYTFTQNGAYKVRVMDTNGCEGYSEITFIQNVGIVPTALSAAIKVFPNPTTGLLHIDAPVKVKLALRDVTGKVVAEGTAVKEMDITAVANGMYLLYISDMNGKLLRADKVTKTAE